MCWNRWEIIEYSLEDGRNVLAQSFALRLTCRTQERYCGTHSACHWWQAIPPRASFDALSSEPSGDYYFETYERQLSRSLRRFTSTFELLVTGRGKSSDVSVATEAVYTLSRR
jgi:hypothetical protein